MGNLRHISPARILKKGYFDLTAIIAAFGSWLAEVLLQGNWRNNITLSDLPVKVTIIQYLVFWLLFLRVIKNFAVVYYTRSSEQKTCKGRTFRTKLCWTNVKMFLMHLTDCSLSDMFLSWNNYMHCPLWCSSFSQHKVHAPRTSKRN